MRRKVFFGNDQETGGYCRNNGIAWHIEVFYMEMHVVSEGQKVIYIDFKLQYLTFYFT